MVYIFNYHNGFPFLYFFLWPEMLKLALLRIFDLRDINRGSRRRPIYKVAHSSERICSKSKINTFTIISFNAPYYCHPTRPLFTFLSKFWSRIDRFYLTCYAENLNFSPNFYEKRSDMKHFIILKKHDFNMRHFQT